MELFRVDCLMGARSIEMDLEELKLSACSLLVCFLRVVIVLAEKSQTLHKNDDPPLYLTVARLTCLGPRVSMTCLL